MSILKDTAIGKLGTADNIIVHSQSQWDEYYARFILSKHGKTGQNLLARPKKIPNSNLNFLTRSKNGLTHNSIRFSFLGQPNPTRITHDPTLYKKIR